MAGEKILKKSVRAVPQRGRIASNPLQSFPFRRQKKPLVPAKELSPQRR
jgi:hypothetical protein